MEFKGNKFELTVKWNKSCIPKAEVKDYYIYRDKTKVMAISAKDNFNPDDEYHYATKVPGIEKGKIYLIQVRSSIIIFSI